MELKKNYKWHKIADEETSLQFGSNNLMQVNIAGKSICIAKTKGDSLYACANKCPHAGGIISDGFIDALNNVVCPIHRYKFNLKNGRDVSGEGYYLRTYPVLLRDDGIYVGIEEKTFLNWF
jgi:3-phenylpropionate/trans-cinnamate dioxygenase ferredoxin subunit